MTALNMVVLIVLAVFHMHPKLFQPVDRELDVQCLQRILHLNIHVLTCRQ